MIIFQREIENQIINNLFKGGMVVILGPRQSGKTTLSQKIINSFGEEGAYFNCEFAEVRKHFVIGEPDKLLDLIKDKNFRDKLLKYFNGKNISIPKSILEKFDIEWSMAEIELFDMFELIVV